MKFLMGGVSDGGKDVGEGTSNKRRCVKLAI